MTRLPSRRSALDWTIDVALLTEPILLAGYAKAMVVVLAIIAALLTFLAAVTGTLEGLPSLLALVGVVAGVVLGLGFAGTALILGNRMRLHFVLDDHGVRRVVEDRRATAAATTAMALGVLAGRPGTTGAGLLARAQSDTSVAWAGIVRVRRRPDRHAIVLSNAWRAVMAVFCPAETYEAVAERIEAEVAAHRGRRRLRGNPLPGLLLRSVVVVATVLPFFVLPYPFERDIFVPMLTLAFALAALWLVPILGVVSIAGLAWMWVEIAAKASGVAVLSRIDRWGPLTVTAVATVVLVALVVGLTTGRVASALGDDEAELADDPPPRDDDVQRPPATKAAETEKGEP